MSLSLDPDQAQHFVEPDLGPTVSKGYQQRTKDVVSKERVKVLEKYHYLMGGLKYFL